MTNVLQLKVELENSNPKIWRRFLLIDELTFEDLHLITNFIMGWEDCHLHDFDIPPNIKIVMDDGDEDFDLPTFGKLKPAKCFKEHEVELLEFLKEENQVFYYTYDFGDNWKHKITVEKINPKIKEAKLNYPVCLDGEMDCPLEDCGGIDGYERLLEIQKNPKNPEYKNIMEWLGNEPVDPDDFDLKYINEELKKINYSRIS